MGGDRGHHSESGSSPVMTLAIQQADWFRADSLRRVVSALTDSDGGPRIVGGAVRDTLLGHAVSDVDLATMLLPNEVMKRLEAAGIKAVPTGLDHGTITAVSDGRNYEVTTLRRDVATDGRRAVVAFSMDWQEDASRRDFTINALYADSQNGEISDYFAGQSDLERGIVRFIGNADQRIAEDYLRILRYFRFFARFGHNGPDPAAISACAKGTHGLTALSRERIAQELTRLLSVSFPVKAVRLMVENAIFAPFLPELHENAADQLAELVKRETRFGLELSLPSRFLSLLPRDAAIADKVAARLKFSNRLRENLAMRVGAALPTADNIRETAYRRGLECARDVAALYADETSVDECLSQLNDWDIPKFELGGGELIAMGLPAGPLVARTLRHIEAEWIKEGFPPPERLSQIASQSVGPLLSATRNA